MSDGTGRKDFDEKLAKARKRRERFSTTSDQPIAPFYGPEEIAGFDYDAKLGYPGAFPFTRGVQPSMYLGRLWTMRQFAGFGTAADTNARFHYLLDHGTTGLSVAFHMPTIMGYDSDHPRSAGEVGKCGVAIDSLADMERLFAGIPLDKVTTSMTINGPAAILFAFYIAVAKKQGVALGAIGGTIQNDILKEYIAQKSWIFPPPPSMRLIADTIEYATTNVPKWNTISISGYHIREAGSTAVQELAFTIYDGIEYVKAGITRGLDVNGFTKRLSFFFNGHNDFFEEIAKYRAARRMWAYIMRDRFGATDPDAMKLRFHTQTAGCSLTAQQPYGNIVRTATQALAAVLGGTQSLHTNSMDETLALPTEQSVTIALRTQQIIAEESGVTNTIDPLAGSYFVEALTDEMERVANEYIARIDAMGGMVPAIEAGFPQGEIAKAAYHYQKQIESGEKTIVGLNKYTIEEEPRLDTLRIDEQVERDQITALTKLKATRDHAKTQAALAKLKAAAEGSDNLMPHIIEAAEAYATVGEITDLFRGVFGTYRDPAYF